MQKPSLPLFEDVPRGDPDHDDHEPWTCAPPARAGSRASKVLPVIVPNRTSQKMRGLAAYSLSSIVAVLAAGVLCALLSGCKENADSAGYSRINSGVPLYRERVTPLYWGVIAGRCIARPGRGCERVQQLIASKQYDVISCNYGPENANGTGFQNYVFWHNRVPDDPLSYAIPGEEHPFLMLGKMTVAKCPEKAGDAEPLFQDSRLYPKPMLSTSSFFGQYSGVIGGVLNLLGPSFLWGLIVHGIVVMASLIYASYKSKSGKWIYYASILAGLFSRPAAIALTGVHGVLIAIGVTMTAWPWAVGAILAVVLGKVIGFVMWMFGFFRNPPVAVGRVNPGGTVVRPAPPPPVHDPHRTDDWQ